MRNNRIRFVCVALTWAVATLSGRADVLHAGRPLEPGRNFSLRITGGQITAFQAMVEETTRRVYELTGETWKQDDAEGYDLDDFNIGDTHATVGFSLEKAWKYISLQLDASIVSISSSAVARRDYYLALDKPIRFNGLEFDNLMIPEGTPFSFDIEGGAVELGVLLTPFTLRPVAPVRLTPFLNLGLFGFIGQYDLDAGETVGVTQYQNPPEDFAVGGRADGILGMGMPQYGGGLEIRIGMENRINLVVQGQYNICQYNGDSSFLTNSDHREKNAEIDHRNARVRAYLEIPVWSTRCLTVGIQFQDVRTDGSITSISDDPEEILALRERFDKEVEFRMRMWSLMAGVTF